MKELMLEILNFAAPLFMGLVIGLFYTILFANKPNLILKWILSVLGILVMVFSIAFYFLFKPTKWFEIFQILMLFIAGLSAFLIVIFSPTIRKYLSSKKINKIINKVTNTSDRNNMKLLGGDLNFFGTEINQMESNSQYLCLKSKSFYKIHILCENPKMLETKIRYGKILSDFGETVELKFYNPDIADLRIRGRLFERTGVKKILMFTKKTSSKYKLIATDTASENGALYNNIWDLIWSLAITPSDSDKQEYVQLYQNL